MTSGAPFVKTIKRSGFKAPLVIALPFFTPAMTDILLSELEKGYMCITCAWSDLVGLDTTPRFIDDTFSSSCVVNKEENPDFFNASTSNGSPTTFPLL